MCNFLKCYKHCNLPKASPRSYQRTAKTNLLSFLIKCILINKRHSGWLPVFNGHLQRFSRHVGHDYIILPSDGGLILATSGHCGFRQIYECRWLILRQCSIQTYHLDLIKIFPEDFQKTLECVLKCCHKIPQEMYMYVIVSRSHDTLMNVLGIEI